MSMLFEPVIALPAWKPSAVLLLPVVLADSALLPTPVPVLVPLAVLPSEVAPLSGLAPTAVIIGRLGACTCYDACGANQAGDNYDLSHYVFLVCAVMFANVFCDWHMVRA